MSLRFEGRILVPAFEGAVNFYRNDNHQPRYDRTPGPAVKNTDDLLKFDGLVDEQQGI